MKKKPVKYTDYKMNVRVIEDFLPPPSELVFKEEGVKVTLVLSQRSVKFFKSKAEELDTHYQTMIRNLLDQYAKRFDPK